MNRVVFLVSMSMMLMTGCESLRTAVHSKEAQGTLLGSLVGAGTLGLIGSVSDHHSGLGAWSGGGAVVGAFAGWFIGHLMAEHNQSSAPESSIPAGR